MEFLSHRSKFGEDHSLLLQYCVWTGNEFWVVALSVTLRDQRLEATQSWPRVPRGGLNSAPPMGPDLSHCAQCAQNLKVPSLTWASPDTLALEK